MYRYLQPTPTPTVKTIDNGAPGLTATVLIFYHQKLPGQCRRSILHRNRQPDAPTFLPVSRDVSVAQNHSFCSWRLRIRGAAVASRKRKETKQPGGTAYCRRASPRQASAQQRWRVVLVVFASAFVSLEGNVPNFLIFRLLDIPTKITK